MLNAEHVKKGAGAQGKDETQQAKFALGGKWLAQFARQLHDDGYLPDEVPVEGGFLPTATRIKGPRLLVSPTAADTMQDVNQVLQNQDTEQGHILALEHEIIELTGAYRDYLRSRIPRRGIVGRIKWSDEGTKNLGAQTTYIHTVNYGLGKSLYSANIKMVSAQEFSKRYRPPVVSIKFSDSRMSEINLDYRIPRRIPKDNLPIAKLFSDTPIGDFLSERGLLLNDADSDASVISIKIMLKGDPKVIVSRQHISSSEDGDSKNTDYSYEYRFDAASNSFKVHINQQPPKGTVRNDVPFYPHNEYAYKLTGMESISPDMFLDVADGMLSFIQARDISSGFTL